MQTYIKQNKLTPPKFKIVLTKGILWTFANGVDSDQNAESDPGHQFASKFDTFGIGKQCKPRSDTAELVLNL